MPTFQKPPPSRTLTDIRSIIHKLKKSNPELEHTSLRNLSVEECQNILMNTFTTSRQRHKARLILTEFSRSPSNADGVTRIPSSA